MSLTPEEEQEIIELMEAEESYARYHKWDSYFPDAGPCRRELYTKHLEFFRAGKEYKERILTGGNQIGKSSSSGYELARHATGVYPEWWDGRTFDRPVEIWIAAPDYKKVMDGMQRYLLGDGSDHGTGFIPKEMIKDVRPQPGTPGCVSLIEVWYKTPNSGRWSTIRVKSYVEGPQAFASATIDIVALDEECIYRIYIECLVRIAKKQGMIMMTYTPDAGATETTLSFFPDGYAKTGPINEYKYAVQISWDDIPHLTEEIKKQLIASMPQHLIDAKTKGVIYLGAGRVYPLMEEKVVCEPFQIPSFFKKAYGLDPGVNRTACIWGAQDPNTGVIYIYDEYYAEGVQPVVAADAIKSRGEWIAGSCDPAGLGIKNFEGVDLYREFLRMGLLINLAQNSVEPGILKIYQLFESGKLKIFSNLLQLRREFVLYRRDMDGKIHKHGDDLMDALRYLIMTGIQLADTEPDYSTFNSTPVQNSRTIDPHTGY